MRRDNAHRTRASGGSSGTPPTSTARHAKPAARSPLAAPTGRPKDVAKADLMHLARDLDDLSRAVKPPQAYAHGYADDTALTAG